MPHPLNFSVCFENTPEYLKESCLALKLTIHKKKGRIDLFTRVIGDESYLDHLPSDLLFLLPQVNPPEFQAALINKNGLVYFSLSLTNDNTSHLLAVFDGTRIISSSLIPFFAHVKHQLMKALQALEEDVPFKFSFPLIEAFQEFRYLPKNRNISLLIFNILSKKQVLVLGDDDSITSHLLELIHILPPEHHNKLNIALNFWDSDYPFDFVFYTDLKFITVKEYALISRNKDVAFLDLHEKACFGKFHSRLADAITKVLLNQDLPSYYSFINEVFHTQDNLSGFYDQSATNLADHLLVPYPDGDMIWNYHKMFIEEKDNTKE